MVSLATTIAGISLENCIFNAAGPRCASKEALMLIAKSESGAVVSKSATLVKREGNEMPRFMKDIDLGPSSAGGSCNSEGLPNQGIDYYISDSITTTIGTAGKPYIVSISGLKLEDNLEMLGRIMRADGVAAIELNLACPNVPGKPVIAYDFDQMDNVLECICAHRDFDKKPVGVKLAPYFDMPHFTKVCQILAKYPIAFVTCINAIGNALFVDIDTESACIAPKGGYGGLGGGYVKQTALANVKKISEGLADEGREDIDVIGVGGVSSGADAFEMILCGAKAVQVATVHWTEGSTCFARINAELRALMDKKGYRSIEEFRGKLKPYVKGQKRRQVSNSLGPSSSREGFLHVTIVALLGVIVALLLNRSISCSDVETE